MRNIVSPMDQDTTVHKLEELMNRLLCQQFNCGFYYFNLLVFFKLNIDEQNH